LRQGFALDGVVPSDGKPRAPPARDGIARHRGDAVVSGTRRPP